MLVKHGAAEGTAQMQREGLSWRAAEVIMSQLLVNLLFFEWYYAGQGEDVKDKAKAPETKEESAEKDKEKKRESEKEKKEAPAKGDKAAKKDSKDVKEDKASSKTKVGSLPSHAGTALVVLILQRQQP